MIEFGRPPVSTATHCHPGHACQRSNVPALSLSLSLSIHLSLSLLSQPHLLASFFHCSDNAHHTPPLHLCRCRAPRTLSPACRTPPPPTPASILLCPPESVQVLSSRLPLSPHFNHHCPSASMISSIDQTINWNCVSIFLLVLVVIPLSLSEPRKFEIFPIWVNSVTTDSTSSVSVMSTLPPSRSYAM
jgi:hypothetical protein